MNSHPCPPPADPKARRLIPRLGLLAAAATLVLYVRPLGWPMLSQDDFEILAQSWTWPRTRDGLWVPQNEHAMPLGRLFTYALVRVAGGPNTLARAAILVGPLALLAALALLYHFVRRELGHPLYGLVAIVLFGVTSVYQQAVFWFAASFSGLALDTLVLGLLAAQRWRRTGRGVYLGLTAVACALAPAWFASGVLAGPLCCLYLFPWFEDRDAPATSPWRRRVAAAVGCLVPLLGTGLFLAISLPRTAARIMHLEHYQGRTALEVFQPLTGLWYTCRSLVDNLMLGEFGISTVEVPVVLLLVALGALAVAGAWWFVHSRSVRLALLGLALILSNYLLVYSARATWGYEGVMTHPGWSRYHLLPQLGLSLFVCAGLTGFAGRWFSPREDQTLTLRQARILRLLIAVCLVVQLPRALLSYFPYDPEQEATLRRIAAVDARCRKYHISGDAARAALPKLSLERWYSSVNGWEFLRGSDNPQPHSPEDVRRLLADGE